VSLPNPSLAPVGVMRPSRRRRGVTLLELLIVLVLMGIAAAVVAPMLRLATPAVASPAAAVLQRARQAAVRRAEPLRVELAADGAWRLTSQRDGVAIDSGSVARADIPASGLADAGAWLVDALGGCLPAPRDARSLPERGGLPYDALGCRDASAVAAR
jgi:prepilin-type N-terminal cleavage/methylation domain-containing protein